MSRAIRLLKYDGLTKEKVFADRNRFCNIMERLTRMLKSYMREGTPAVLKGISDRLKATKKNPEQIGKALDAMVLKMKTAKKNVDDEEGVPPGIPAAAPLADVHAAGAPQAEAGLEPEPVAGGPPDEHDLDDMEGASDEAAASSTTMTDE